MKIIHSRYQLASILGEGGIGTTYHAKDIKTNQKVAIKVISLSQISDWKTIDLFEREGRVLKQLSHSAIPAYIDSFQVDGKRDRLFCLVQEFAPGKSLAQWVKEGWKPDEKEVVAIATQLLDILIYLQQFTPPILHRDLKPQNILRDNQGQIYLVDFGAVQDTYRQTVTGGSTVVGTFGYMAPEQYRGQATLGTDLYGLGTTLLFLLTGKDPIDLPQTDDLQIKIPADIHLSSKKKRWLQRLIDPATESRFTSAQIALNSLNDQTSPTAEHNTTPAPIQLSQTSQIIWIRTDDALQIKFSAVNHLLSAIGIRPNQFGASIVIILCSLWLVIVFLLFWLPASTGLNLGNVLQNPQIILFVIIKSAIAITAFRWTYNFLTKSTLLYIDQDEFKLQGFLRPLKPYQIERLRLPEVQDIRLQPHRGNPHCILETSFREKLYFGHGLPKQEQQWIVTQLRDFLQSRRNNVQKQHQETQADYQQVVSRILQKGIEAYRCQPWSQGKPESQVLFEAARLVDSNCAEAYNNLGVILFHKENYKGAIAAFKTALSKTPGYWAAHINLAIAYDTSMDMKHWLQTFTTSLTNTEAQDRQIGRAEHTLIVLKDYPDSLATILKSFRTKLKYYSDTSRLRYDYAHLLMFQGNFAEAIALYANMIAQLPKKELGVTFIADIYFDYGWALAMQGDIQAALEQWRAIASLPSPKNTTKVKALIQHYQG
ncbi:MAG: serine/threonine-protein kinase [Cyanobacteria bacterium P01_F01_bin.150]